MRDWVLWFAQVVLAAIGCVGIVYAYRTLKTIERQTKAAEETATAARDSAEAAKLNAQALIDSERAWLIISAVEGQVYSGGDLPIFKWSVKNVGKTPARLIETQAVCERRNPLETLSEPPGYPSGAVVLNGRILVPGDSIGFYVYTGLQPENSKLGNPSLLAFGYIKYSVPFRDACESNFCQSHSLDAIQKAEQMLVFCPRLDAPSSYTKHT